MTTFTRLGTTFEDRPPGALTMAKNCRFRSDKRASRIKLAGTIAMVTKKQNATDSAAKMPNNRKGSMFENMSVAKAVVVVAEVQQMEKNDF